MYLISIIEDIIVRTASDSLAAKSLVDLNSEDRSFKFLTARYLDSEDRGFKCLT